MATSYTSLLGLALPTTGELQGTWGDTVNNSITSLLDTAVAGTTTLSTDGDVTLSTTTGAANQARQAILLCSGARTAQRTITAPAQSKIYTVVNATTGGYAVKIVGVGPTTGVIVPAGKAIQVVWNGSDFVELSPNSITGGLTLSGNLLFTPDNTYDIGASGATRARNLYLGGTATIGSGTASAQLHVFQATGGSDTAWFENTSTNAVVRLKAASTYGAYIDSYAGSSAASLYFRPGGTTAGQITTDGAWKLTNVATGQAKLQVGAYAGSNASTSGIGVYGNSEFSNNLYVNASTYLGTNNPSSGGGYLALNTTSPGEYFDINTNDDYGQFTAALNGSPFLLLRYAKGNLSAKTTLVSGDQHNIIFQGYDGTQFYNMSAITTFAASTVSTGVVPGRLEFRTSASAGALTSAFIIDQNQYCTIGNTVVNNYPLYIGKNPASAANAMLYIYPSTATNSAHVIFNNAGSGSVQIGRADSTGVVQTFNTGTAYATAIVNSGTVPIYFGTNNTHAMNISTGQYVAISSVGTGANVPLSVFTPASTSQGYMFEINPATPNNSASMMLNNTGSGSFYIGRASSTGGGAGSTSLFNASEAFVMNSGTQKLVLGTNSYRALIVDSSGYVTTPYQPSFNVYQAGSITGAQTPVKFDTVRHNIGSGYSTSTGRFTAPVDGVYFFSVTNNVIQANNIDGVIRKNGSSIIGVEYDVATAGVWLGLTATTVLQLSAGDYVDYIIGNGGSYTVEGTPWNNFVGFLIG